MLMVFRDPRGFDPDLGELTNTDPISFDHNLILATYTVCLVERVNLPSANSKYVSTSALGAILDGPKIVASSNIPYTVAYPFTVAAD